MFNKPTILLPKKLDLEKRRSTMIGLPSIHDYVTDGLLFFLDGIANTRNGHDATSLTWQDLSGNDQDITYDSNKEIGDYYCVPNASVLTSFPFDKTYTIEFVLDMPVPSGTNPFCIICPTSDASNATNYDELTDEIVFGTATSSTGYRIPRVDAISTYNSQGYVNGSSGTWNVPGSSWTWSYASNTELFGYSDTEKRICKKRICAIRIYSRSLTAGEIAHNASVDRARFGSYRSATPKLPNGYSEVEYIRSDGNAWLTLYASSTQDGFLSGDIINTRVMRLSGTSEAGFVGYDGSFELYFSNGKYNVWKNVSAITPASGTDVALNTAIDISVTVTANLNYYLVFRYATNRYPFDGRIYSFSVTRNGTTIVNLTPCIRTSDSMAGMYDIINGVFYPSEGSTEFIAGDSV